MRQVCIDLNIKHKLICPDLAGGWSFNYIRFTSFVDLMYNLQHATRRAVK